MSKGAWIVVGWIILQSLFIWANRVQFLEHNVWQEGRIEKADEIKVQVDFLELRTARFVEQCVGFIGGGLFVAFIYLAVQMRRIEKRLEGLADVVAPASNFSPIAPRVHDTTAP